MNFTRREALKLAGLGISTSLLAACGNDSGSSGDGTVRFEGWDYEAKLVQQNIDRFTKLNADIKVAYTPITSAQYVQKVVAEFTGNAGPDALYVYDDSLVGWVEAGYLQPLDGLDGVDEVYDAIFPSNAEAMTYKGKRYGLPYYTDSQCLVYNAEILGKAGFTAPPASLDELEQQALKIKSDGLLQYPMGVCAQLSDTWWSWVWALIFSSGGDMFDKDATPVMKSKDPTTKNVFAWLQSATNTTKILDPASLQLLPIPLDNAMMSSQYAFSIVPRYALRNYNDPAQSKAAGKMKMALMPGLEAESKGTVSNTRMYSLSANTEVKDKAFTLLTYLGGYTDKVPYTAKFWFMQRGLGFTFEELADDSEVKQELAKFADPAIYQQLAESAHSRNVLGVPWYTEFETEMHKVVQQVMSNQVTPDAAVASLDKTVGDLKKKYS
ncbi:sugar ABC transporter substrate-binding protein [Actinophytocola sp.]|uniref:ABC transporter substrate-binding protein n=1 Tax=Actinophytocola sp. TaxID=1872138 RepID=UPI002ED12E00